MLARSIIIVIISFAIPFAGYPTGSRIDSLCVYDALINLGGDCQVAYQLKRLNQRLYALPFDRVLISVEGVCKLLKDRFALFLKPETLVLKQGTDSAYILDTVYGARFIHDFPLDSNFMRAYSEINKCYQRRINRLLSVIATSTTILFIRKNITQKEAQLLVTTLTELLPAGNFCLLALDTTQEIAVDWQIPHCVNTYLQQPTPYSWRGDDTAWETIMSRFNLELTSLPANTTGTE